MKVAEILVEMAKRASPDQFYGFAKKLYGDEKVKSLTWPEIMAVAKENDVLIPAYLRSQKVGRGRFSVVPPEHADTKALSKEEPKVEKKTGVDIEEIKKLFPELGQAIYGDMLHWHVSEWKGQVSIEWTYTFRRNTQLGAFHDNQQRIEAGNNRLEAIARKYSFALVSKRITTAASAKASDEARENDGRSAYSEYEQSMGSSILLKAN